MKYPEFEPTINGQAAIIHSEILLTSIKKGQFDEIIEYLIERDFDFEYGVEAGDSIVKDKYWLSIKELPWAANGFEIFKIAKDSDYNNGEYEG